MPGTNWVHPGIDYQQNWGGPGREATEFRTPVPRPSYLTRTYDSGQTTLGAPLSDADSELPQIVQPREVRWHRRPEVRFRAADGAIKQSMADLQE